MLVHPDEKIPIARLLTFLEHGERMAHDCAKAQALLAEDSGTRRFLLSQAKQEAMHARVFQGGRCLTGAEAPSRCPVPSCSGRVSEDSSGCAGPARSAGDVPCRASGAGRFG